MPSWAMDTSSGCSSPADTGSQLLFQPQMEPGTRHSVTVPGPIRQWGVSGCDGDGVDAVVVLGALPSECRARWQGPQMALHPRAEWQGPQMSPKPRAGHTDTPMPQDMVAEPPECLCKPGQSGRAGSRGTQISPCPRTGWQGPQISLHPRACACPQKREIITQKAVKEEAPV